MEAHSSCGKFRFYPDTKMEGKSSCGKVRFTEWKQCGCRNMKKLMDARANAKSCDITLVTNDEPIQAHSIVLSAASLYFEALFKYRPEGQKHNDVNLCEFSTSIVRSIIDYMYTGLTEVVDEDIEELLIAANFFNLLPLRRHCIQYLSGIINPHNCASLLHFAEIYAFAELRKKALRLCTRHFVEAYKNPDFPYWNPDTFLEIFGSASLVIEEKGIIPCAEREEHIRLKVLLAYINGQDDEVMEQRNNVLVHAVKCLRVDNMDYRTYKTLKNLIRHCGGDIQIDPYNSNKERWPRHVPELAYGKEYLDWGTDCGLSYFHSQPGSTEDLSPPPPHVTGIQVWVQHSKSFLGSFITGVRVHYSHGESTTHGGCYGNMYEAFIDQDQRIVKVTMRTGSLVDCLVLETNDGETVRVYDNPAVPTACRQTDKPPGGALGYLAGLKGAVCQAIYNEEVCGIKTITQLQFQWAYYRHTIHTKSAPA